MKHTLRLLIAVAIAVAAGAANYFYLNQQAAEFIVAKAEVAETELITDDHLDTIRVAAAASQGENNGGLIPADKRHLLIGRSIGRPLKPGDLLFLSDLNERTYVDRYERIGPFKLIGVGESLTAALEGIASSGMGGGGGQSLTIAVPEDFDGATRRLLDVIRSGRGAGGSTKEEESKIVAVVITEASKTATPSQTDPATDLAGADPLVPGERLPLDEGYGMLSVTLDSVTLVPRVLRLGDQISFIATLEGDGDVYELDVISGGKESTGGEKKAVGDSDLSFAPNMIGD